MKGSSKKWITHSQNVNTVSARSLGSSHFCPPVFFWGKQKNNKVFLSAAEISRSHALPVYAKPIWKAASPGIFLWANILKESSVKKLPQGSSSVVAVAVFLCCWLALTVESPHKVMNKLSSLCFCHGITWAYQSKMSRNLFYKTTLFWR